MLSTAAVRDLGTGSTASLHACPAKALPSQTTAYGSEPAEADKLLIARTNIGSALETWSTSDELIWRVNSIMMRVLARRTARYAALPSSVIDTRYARESDSSVVLLT